MDHLRSLCLSVLYYKRGECHKSRGLWRREVTSGRSDQDDLLEVALRWCLGEETDSGHFWGRDA